MKIKKSGYKSAIYIIFNNYLQLKRGVIEEKVKFKD